MRDSVRGQSLGKALMGIVVISIETGRPCTVKASIWRNILLVVPGVNVVTIFLEPVTIVRDPQGLRLGDRVAQTQVVEGVGAKDMAAAFQRWWRSVASGLSPGVRRDVEPHAGLDNFRTGVTVRLRLVVPLVADEKEIEMKAIGQQWPRERRFAWRAGSGRRGPETAPISGARPCRGAPGAAGRRQLAGSEPRSTRATPS
jgi:hypothetical protein